jgi:hypothetical protein
MNEDYISIDVCKLLLEHQDKHQNTALGWSKGNVTDFGPGAFWFGNRLVHIDCGNSKPPAQPLTALYRLLEPLFVFYVSHHLVRPRVDLAGDIPAVSGLLLRNAEREGSQVQTSGECRGTMERCVRIFTQQGRVQRMLGTSVAGSPT